MKFALSFGLLLSCILLPTYLDAISFVYNFRIAQITKQPIFEPIQRKHSVIALLIDQYQKKYSGTTQNFAGGLAAYIYNFGSNFIRTDFAVSHIHEKEKVCREITFSDTETDDILFTMGRQFVITDKASTTFSGLFGIPTHNILRLKHVDFGYGQIGTGLQFDGSYEFVHDNFMLWGTRYIYFVPRGVQDDCKNHYTFTIGNTADIILSYNAQWKAHGLELGFTERWQFGSHVRPNFDTIVDKTNYSRSNFYAVYKHKFLTKNVAQRFLFNIAYGFDNQYRTFNNKSIITVWASWNIRF